MLEVVKLLIGIFVLVLGIPMGNFLAKSTKEELKSGHKYFVILTLIGLVGGFIGLIIGNDVLLFSFFFIAIVTSGSLKNGKKRR